MRRIEGILFEPVGCLAEFPAEPFHEIAVRLFGGRKKASKSGSRAYWHLLNLSEQANPDLSRSEREMVEALEVQAADGANVYDDVVPALSELKAMGTRLLLASSLSSAAITHFLERWMPRDIFTAVWNRDNAGGIKGLPLRCALDCASLDPERTMFLTDTAEGLKVANIVGVHSILMMNDPDEAKRLAMHDPAGGIVSMYELPDFIRLLAARNA
jgi:phosphoglycolate phosphatase-like HAD superfamily hydrolase